MDRGQNLPWCWGTTNGRAAFQLRYQDRKRLLVTEEPLRPGEWVQLTAVYALPHLRLYVNGRQAASQFSSQVPSLARGVWLGNLAGTRPVRPTVAVEDFAVFERALSADEVAAWHAIGRGMPMKFHERRALRSRLTERGTPWLLALTALLTGLAILPWLRNQVFGGLRELASPPLRAVRWTLLAGTVLTVGLAGFLARAGRQKDQQHLQLITETFHQSADSYLERMSDLLLRLCDQMAGTTNLTPAGLREWLSAQNFPHDQPGLYAVGVALRTEADALPEFERSWAAHYKGSYTVWPPVLEAEQVSWRGHGKIIWMANRLRL